MKGPRKMGVIATAIKAERKPMRKIMALARAIST